MIPVPSRKQVQKAGKALAKGNATPDELSQAMAILSQWRSLHSYPINTFQAMLRGKVKSLNLKSLIIAQRLKRAPSIIRKLQRFPSMDLSRMQDIGGLRIVLSSVEDVYRLHTNIIKGQRSQHEPLLPPNDYIKQPKADGYRSLHQVFKYKSQPHPNLDGLFIELQIRTKLQHSWATAVETLGIIEKSSFKTGEWKGDFKRFFQLASALFSYHEKQPVLPEFANIPINKIVQDLLQIEQDLQIFAKLQGLIITGSHIETNDKKSNGYHLMELDTSKGTVSLIAFSNSQLEKAENFYQLREIQIRDNPNIELVLISAGNLKDIKKAYPNYFLDTQEFIKHLTNICEKVTKKANE